MHLEPHIFTYAEVSCFILTHWTEVVSFTFNTNIILCDVEVTCLWLGASVNLYLLFNGCTKGAPLSFRVWLLRYVET